MFHEFQFGPIANEHPEALLALVIGFLLLLFLLVKVNIPVFSLPYLRGVLNDRASRIQDAHEQVDRALADVRQLHDDYASRLQRIETEARQRIDEAVREAELARTEIISEARQSAEALRRRSEEELARERTRQRILLRQQLVAITLDAAEESVRAATNDSVQRSLIQDFITRASANGDGRAVMTVPAAPIKTDGAELTQTQSQSQTQEEA